MKPTIFRPTCHRQTHCASAPKGFQAGRLSGSAL